MADVTTTFGAKDVGVAATIQRLQGRLASFQASMMSVSASAKRMQGAFSNLGRSVVGLAAAYVGVTQAISAFNKAMDFGGRMNDLSEITGESAGNLAVLERAFDNTGVGGEKMMPMLAKMTEFIQQLEKGQGEAVATASKLGVTFADLKNKTPIERFQTLLRAVAGLTNENDRLNASQDVFGTRMGGRLIPLINSFSAEMAAASKQLGSVVEILNRNSAGIDEFGDRVQKAIAAKPMEFMLGFLDEMTGRTENLAKAISEIDTAAAGQNFAKMFSGAMKAPGLAFLAIGETLLLYIKKAGNMLVEAALFAGEVYRKSFTDRAVFSRIASGFGNALGLWANWFNRILASGIKTILSPLAAVPLLGLGIKPAIAQIERLQAGLDASAKSMGKSLTDALAGGANRMSEIASTTARPSFKLFDEADQKAQADAAFARLKQLGAADNKTAATAAEPPLSPVDAQQRRLEIQKTYNEQLEAIRKSSDSSEEFGKRLRTLNQQMNEALRDLNARSLGNAVNQNAMPQATREEIARQASALPTTAQEEVASEPTLKRAVDLLAELNTKLPQPVLV